MYVCMYECVCGCKLISANSGFGATCVCKIEIISDRTLKNRKQVAFAVSLVFIRVFFSKVCIISMTNNLM